MTRTVDNRTRPAQPEPGEDPAVEKPPSVREEVRTSRPRETHREPDRTKR